MKTIRQLFLALLLCGLNGAALAANTIKMNVEGLVCAFCGSAIEKKLKSRAEVEDVLVSLEQRIVAIGLKPGADISDDTLKAEINDAGYQVKAIERTDQPLSDVRAALKAQK